MKLKSFSIASFLIFSIIFRNHIIIKNIEHENEQLCAEINKLRIDKINNENLKQRIYQLEDQVFN